MLLLAVSVTAKTYLFAPENYGRYKTLLGAAFCAEKGDTVKSVIRAEYVVDNYIYAKKGVVLDGNGSMFYLKPVYDERAIIVSKTLETGLGFRFLNNCIFKFQERDTTIKYKVISDPELITSDYINKGDVVTFLNKIDFTKVNHVLLMKDGFNQRVLGNWRDITKPDSFDVGKEIEKLNRICDSLDIGCSKEVLQEIKKIERLYALSN